MADKQITDLTDASAVAATDIYLTRQGSDTEDKKATALQLKTYIESSLDIDNVSQGTTVYVLPEISNTTGIIIDPGGTTVSYNAGNVSIGVGNVVGTTGDSQKENNTAIGTDNQATDRNTTAVGYQNRATGINSVAFGDDNLTDGVKTVGVGNSNDVSGESSICIGDNNTTHANAQYAISMGKSNNVIGAGSIALGNALTVTQDQDNVIYYGAKTILLGQFATGSLPTAADREGGIVYDSTTNTVKFCDGSSWANIGGGLDDVADDATPQLGGDLDVDGNSIISTSNGDIAITPNGTGSIVLDGLNWPQADGSSNQVLKTDGAGQLSWTANTGSGLADIVDDTTPQLGGDLDVNGNGITFTGATVTDVTGADTLLVSGTAGTSGNLAEWNGDGDLVDSSVTADDVVISDPTGVTGADAITNIMSLTQAEYNAITPDSATLYIITDAS